MKPSLGPVTVFSESGSEMGRLSQSDVSITTALSNSFTNNTVLPDNKSFMIFYKSLLWLTLAAEITSFEIVFSN